MDDFIVKLDDFFIKKVSLIYFKIEEIVGLFIIVLIIKVVYNMIKFFEYKR